MRLYERFAGKELEIAELIQRRRLQVLVHSYIYYERNTNLVTDAVFDRWCAELVKLHADYPELSKQVPYHKDFAGWDGSTGAFLPYKDQSIVNIAERLLYKPTTNKVARKVARGKLF